MKKKLLFCILSLFAMTAVAQTPVKKPVPKPAAVPANKPTETKPKTATTVPPKVVPKKTLQQQKPAPTPAAPPQNTNPEPLSPVIHTIPIKPSAPVSAPQQQTQTTQPVVTQNQAPVAVPLKLHYDEFWISGSLGAGAVVSTNIINSGGVLPFRTEFLWQKRHRRLGFGIGKELYLTPEALGKLILGQSPGIKKLYFVYEKFIFRNFPINLGFSSHLGLFTTGDTLRDKNGVMKASSGGVFGNVGAVVEAGIRPFYIFVRPDIEYQSWSGFHKQIQSTVSVGIRLKFLSREEKERRAAKKIARQQRRKKSK